MAGLEYYARPSSSVVWLILEVWIDDQLTTFREVCWETDWERIKASGRENYLEYWIKMCVGLLATKDAEQMARLRKKLLVAEPSDSHDFPRCKRSEDNPRLPVRCIGGMICRVVVGEDVEQVYLDDELDCCPCRCHQLHREAFAFLRTKELVYFSESTLTATEALAEA